MQLDAFGYEERDGKALADKGIKAAVDHADRVVKGWSDQAYATLLSYAAISPVGFTAEDVREFAEKAGVPQPPNAKAWGGPFKRARIAGRIRRVGFGTARFSQAHGAPKALWLRTA